ncbi:MAG TPA: heavy-metal-associated domain-containing protein [Actinomycetales bacterium]|uniref:heavy-metal-associated domain-containing protein n=1 Tax=Dietzia sp. 179-F 9C3 NHS TaxID=3374295 RepID=UPI0017757904|nr:heavy-metal-associated domain-containing protein [Actinomycetales bacterium]
MSIADNHTATYTVSGMTCGHCVASVEEEVSEIPGVSSVEVELASGRLVVVSPDPIDPALVRAAVDEAGYTVTDQE